MEETGSPLHLNTEVTELVEDENGQILNVKAIYHDETITYHGKNGVIIDSGGFGYNKEMRTQYNMGSSEEYLSTSSVGSTGDGILVAEKVGAGLEDMDYIQAYPTCDAQSGTLLM